MTFWRSRDLSLTGSHVNKDHWEPPNRAGTSQKNLGLDRGEFGWPVISRCRMGKVGKVGGGWWWGGEWWSQHLGTKLSTVGKAPERWMRDPPQ